VFHSRVLDRGSLGPSTVTLIALLYVVPNGGMVPPVIALVKLFPVDKKLSRKYALLYASLKIICVFSWLSSCE